MNKRALMIVEGERDKDCIKVLCNIAGIPVETVVVSANIHMLYPSLKKEDFMLDIVEFLKSWNGISEADRKVLEETNDFAYLYLVFDFDIQHHKPGHESNIEKNINTLLEMIDHFTDETDGTIGKLYINYPMFESLRDYDLNSTDVYMNRDISVIELLQEKGIYKRVVNDRGTGEPFIFHSIEDLRNVALLNVKKGNKLINDAWEMPDYNIYRKNISQQNIALSEAHMVSDAGKISVLNSIPFIAIDYWGNESGFYDSLRENSEIS